ncbi:MAG: methyl-accepting chemotaxis protein, partial [Rhodoferax sp.]|nr:methyl-accepting chemotaxis protein [Rhodoferax sp.]
MKGRFESFLQKDLALLQAVTGMYADGLQCGQALRNIVLDPANKTTYKNLEKAGDEFKEKSRKALSLVASEATDRKMLEDLIALREQYIPVQIKIIGLASSDQTAAIASVNQHETPLWRSIRERLLNFINIKNVAVEKTKTQLEAFSQQILMTALALMLVALMLGAGIISWLIRNIMRQLGGEPVYAIEVARAISDGDLSRIIKLESGDGTSLLSAMNAMRENLTATIGGVRQATDTIACASSQIAAGNLDLSGRTEQQASSLEETAASMEELTSTVKQNADNARQANQLAVAASGVAVKGGSVVSQVVDTMDAINSSSRKIVDIIGVIDGIAFQTNILALNAAVDAARAGEQGRGIAVVAAEVRNLAQRSAAAAKEIKTLIGDSVAKVEEGSQQVTQAGQTMDQIVDSVKRVTDIMAEITAASQEQTSGIEQINQAITQMDQVTQQNAALVEEAAAAASSLQEQAGSLSQVVSVFKLNHDQAGGPAHHVNHVAAPQRT